MSYYLTQMLKRATSLVDFRRGEAIITQGRPGDAFFVIVSGRVEVSRVADAKSPVSGEISPMPYGVIKKRKKKRRRNQFLTPSLFFFVLKVSLKYYVYIIYFSFSFFKSTLNES